MKAFQTLWVVFVLLFGRAAWCARPDALSSTTAVGPYNIIESLFIRRHFDVSEFHDESFFSQHRDEVNAQEAAAYDARQGRATRPRLFQPSSLSWELGYAYSSPAVTQPATSMSAGLPGVPSGGVRAPTGSLDSHSVQGGLDWEALPTLDLSLRIGADTLPAQDYRHGRITLRGEYFKPLPIGANRQRLSRIRAEEQSGGDPRDARSYYTDHVDGYVPPEQVTHYMGGYVPRGATATMSREEDEEDPDAQLRAQLRSSFPSLKAALFGTFDKHILESPTFQAVDQFSLGPDLELDWNERTRFHLLGYFSAYSGNVAVFAAQLPASIGTALLVPADSLAAFLPQFLVFPDMVIEEGVSQDLGERWTVELYLNQVLYDLGGFGLGIAPIVSCLPSPSWKVGVGAATMLGGATNVVGLLNLSYLF